MNNLGIYFDNTGYAVTRYSQINESFRVDFIGKSDKASTKTLYKVCEQLKPIDSVYINSSKIAVGGLYKCGFSIVENNLVTEQIEKSETNSQIEQSNITFLDCYETVCSMLEDELIMVSNEYENLFIENFKSYTLEDNNHVVLSTFYGIALQYLESLEVFRKISLLATLSN